MKSDHVSMDMQQLRYAVAVAEERSFTRAAAKCFVVQSALSHQIKALERELGVELFARTSRKVELTASGHAFVKHARIALDAVALARVEAVLASGVIEGDLCVGVIPTVTAVEIPAALGAFKERFPDVRVTLRGGSSDDFQAAIATGTMDVALLGLPAGVEPRGVSSIELSRNQLAAIVSPDHALGAVTSVDLQALVLHSFVDFPAGTSGRVQSDLAFARAHLERDVAYEVMDMDVMLGLVARGLAIALLDPQVVRDRKDVRAIPILDGPVRVEHLAWSAFNPSPAARAFVEHIAPGRPAS
jgi:DNA-binding transcriptional LysR family regulator